MQKSIPFNKPFIIGKELFYIAQAVLSGHLSGDGVFTKKCHKLMEQKYGAKKVLLTNSCTSALEMTAILANIQPGDEVILPSYTFVSTANAFALRGAILKFIDINKDTLNMDELLIEEAISKKTKAIVPVHYAGVSCNMDPIMDIANLNNIIVIEDAAQAMSSKYKGRYLGTIGHLGSYSFHETKNITSGEGGALIINDNLFVDRAEVIREKGTNRSLFLKGMVDKYTWVDLGSSYLPSELVAAFLFAQLEEAEKINKKRLTIWANYYNGLKPLEGAERLQLPTIPDYCEHNAHMFYIILPTLQIRDQLIQYLRKNGICSVFHYVPLHSSPMGMKLSIDPFFLPITDNMSGRLLRLPCFFELNNKEQEKVIEVIFSFFKKYI